MIFTKIEKQWRENIREKMRQLDTQINKMREIGDNRSISVFDISPIVGDLEGVIENLPCIKEVLNNSKVRCPL
jgi:hypothetical protein